MPKFSGKCLCGDVTYLGDAEPAVMLACHCKDCQRSTGTAFLTAVGIPNDAVTFAGALKTYTRPGGTTGLPINRNFCGLCGSPVYLERENAGRVLIMAGTLNDTSFVRPGKILFCASAQEWLQDQANIPSFEQ
jgi:hypothetical protein